MPWGNDSCWHRWVLHPSADGNQGYEHDQVKHNQKREPRRGVNSHDSKNLRNLRRQRRLDLRHVGQRMTLHASDLGWHAPGEFVVEKIVGPHGCEIARRSGCHAQKKLCRRKDVKIKLRSSSPERSCFATFSVNSKLTLRADFSALAVRFGHVRGLLFLRCGHSVHPPSLTVHENRVPAR